jgi:hypothetical protein
MESQTIPTPPPEEKIEVKQAQSDGASTIESSIPGKWLINGKVVDEIRIKHYRVTRRMRNEALEESAIAYRQRYGEKGMLPTVFEESLARRIIKWWSLPTHVTSGGWDLIEDPDLGDKIAKVIGIDAAYESLTDSGKESQDAKN